MWILTIVLLINGGESPTKFETRKYKTYSECLAAAKIAERRVGTFGYCDKEK